MLFCKTDISPTGRSSSCILAYLATLGRLSEGQHRPNSIPVLAPEDTSITINNMLVIFWRNETTYQRGKRSTAYFYRLKIPR